MEPMYMLLLCLPAALGLMASACGLAVLWSPAARPPKPRERLEKPRSAGTSKMKGW